METSQFVDYKLKAKQYLLINRPYGIRIDRSKQGYVLFNKHMNILGNYQSRQLKLLPIESFEKIEDIPMEGEVFEKKDNNIIDLFLQR